MKYIYTLLILMSFMACSVSYRFTGTSIDYNKVKTMVIQDFVNQAPTVYPPLAIELNDYLQNYFTRNTKLNFVKAGGDLELEGEIIRYELSPLSVQESKEGVGLLASMTRLTMAVKIRFRDNTNPALDKEETLSAYRDFDSSKSLDEVQNQLNKELIEDIVDQIFNVTLSNW